MNKARHGLVAKATFFLMLAFLLACADSEDGDSTPDTAVSTDSGADVEADAGGDPADAAGRDAALDVEDRDLAPSDVSDPPDDTAVDAGDDDTFVPDDAGPTDTGDLDVPEDTTPSDITPDGGVDLGFADVAGRVTGTDGAAVEGARVLVDGEEVARTDAIGRWQAELPRGVELVVRVEAEGWTNDARPAWIDPQASAWRMGFVLARRAPPAVLVDPSSGGTVVGPLGARVVFPRGAIVDADGDPVAAPVLVYMTALDYAEGGAFDAFPGTEEAIDEDGEQTGLISLGVVEVELRSGGEEVRLADGATATLDIPITVPGGTSEPTIPVWSLDEDTGLWRHEGVGTVTRQDGRLVLRAEVGHFSWWNVDVNRRMRNLTVRVFSEDEGGTRTSWRGALDLSAWYAGDSGLMETEAYRVPDLGGVFGTRVLRGLESVLRVISEDGRFGEVVVPPAEDPSEVEIVLEDATADVVLIAEETAVIEADGPAVRYVEAPGGVGTTWEVRALVRSPASVGMQELQPAGSPRLVSVRQGEVRVSSGPMTPERPGRFRLVFDGPGRVEMTMRDTRRSGVEFDGTVTETVAAAEVTFPFVAQAGTWVRAFTVSPHGGTVSLRVLDVRGDPITGLGVSVQAGETGAVPIPRTGEYRIGAFSTGGPQEVEIALRNLGVATVVDGRLDGARTLDEASALRGAVFAVPTAVGDTTSVRVEGEASNPSVPMVTLGTRNGTMWSVPTTVLERGAPAASRWVARVGTSEADARAPSFVFVAHRRGGTGALRLAVDTADPGDSIRVGDCEGAHTGSFWAGLHALRPGGTLEVCPGEHVSPNAAVLPPSGTVQAIGQGEAIVSPWPGFAWNRVGFQFNGPVLLEGVTLRAVDSGNQLGVPFQSAEEQLTLRGVTFEGVRPAGAGQHIAIGVSGQGTLTVEDCRVDGYAQAINAAGGVTVIRRLDAVGTSLAISANSPVRLEVVDSTLDATTGCVTSNNTNGRDIRIEGTTCRLDPDGANRTALFVVSGPSATGPMIVQDNVVEIVGGMAAGVVVGHANPHGLALRRNRVIGDGGTANPAIQLRDVSPSATLGAARIENNLVLGTIGTGLSIAAVGAIPGLAIVHNTIVAAPDASSAVTLLSLSPRGAVTGATETTVSNNLFVGASVDRDIGVQQSAATWRASIGSNRYALVRTSVANAGTPPLGDQTLSGDPQVDADGVPAITTGIRDSAVTLAPPVTDDVDGDPRPVGLGNDIGAQEF